MKIGNTGHKISQESFKTKMKTIFYNLDIKNNICPDCGKTKSMDYASINNGIIICAECAKEHEKLGYNISFLRSLGEKWDDYLFNYIKAGGNSRFIQFCKDYKIDKGNNNIIQKYKSKGLTYYRDIIRSEVLGYDPPDNINVNKAYEEEPEIPDNYPEFKKYTFVKHVDKNYTETNFYTKKEEKVKEEEDEGIFGKIGGLWGSVKKKIGDEAGDLMKKVSEIDYNSVKEKGASMFDYFFGDDKDKEKNNNESAHTINEKEKIDRNEDNNINNKKDESILKNIFGVNTKTYEKDKNINQIGNNYEKIEENDKGEYNNKEENKNTEIKENKSEQKEEEEKEQEKEQEKKQEKKEEKKEEKIEEKKEEKIEEKKEDKVEEKKEEKIEEKKEDKVEEKKEDSEKKIEENKEKQKEKIKEEQNIENKDKENSISENKEEKNEEKAKEEEKKNYNDIKDEKDEQNIEKEKKDIKQEENAETKNYDIENILNDNAFSNDNSKMNNEEKDELEKMLQE